MFEQSGLDLEALAVAAPGPGLAAMLAGIDPCGVNGHVRVVVMQAWQRQVSWSSGRLYDLMAFVARSPEGTPDSAPELTETFGEFAGAEVGAALRLSPGVADAELCFAYQLTERLPSTRAWLEAGRIDVATARTIAEETSWLSDELAVQAEAAILGQVERLTRQQVQRRLRRLVLKLDPVGAEERHRDGHRQRRVRLAGGGADGTATLAGYDLPIAEATAAHAFVRAAAKALRAAGDTRSLAQLEADVYLDLLQGRHLDTGGIRATVELVAPLQTWLGVGIEPADLAGVGAISAETLAELRNLAAASAGIDFSHTATITPAGPSSGSSADTDAGAGADTSVSAGTGAGSGPDDWNAAAVVHHHRAGNYRPSKAQRDFLRARDRTCRQPGCSRPARACDLDHTTPHRLGGPSCPCNLITLCRRHHRAKHHAGWWWTRAPNDVDTVQSPLGHTYAADPEPPPGAHQLHR